jgi:hypothetical protein
MGWASGVRHACGPPAVFEECIVTHGINQFVIVNHGLVVVRTRKNGPAVYNSARRRAMDVDNNSREAFFAFVLPTGHVKQLWHGRAFAQKREGKRKTRRKNSQKFFNFFSWKGRLDGHWTPNGKSGDRYLFMLSRLAST